MTGLDLAAIRHRAENATKGPWHVHELPVPVSLHTHTIHSEHGTTETWTVDLPPEIGALHTQADATFIAHARVDIPALLDRVDTLTARLAAVRELVAEFEAEDIMPVGQATLIRAALNGPPFPGKLSPPQWAGFSNTQGRNTPHD